MTSIEDLRACTMYFKDARPPLFIGVSTERVLREVCKDAIEEIANEPGEKMTPDDVAFSLETIETRRPTQQELHKEVYDAGCDTLEEFLSKVDPQTPVLQLH